MFAKYQGVFRSRWKALFWALGVCLTAYCTVPQEGQDNADVVPGMGMLSHHKKADHHDAVDPWAVDQPGKKQG